jgi:creatinine amidohydrolase
MQWEHLSTKEFSLAVRKTGVCILPTGVLEPHSDHMPLGTDCLISHKLACLAAEKEKAVVFPNFFFGQIFEARCFPGTVTLPPKLLLDLFLSLLDEIGRNGFRKIIIVNGHGGNEALLPLITQFCLAEDKPYQVYLPTFAHISEDRRKKSKWGDLLTRLDHAGEWEASLLLATNPEHVHLDRAPAKGGKALGRMKHLPPTRNAMAWYADHPEHYAGDARRASLEKGIAIRDGLVDTLADYIAAVKADRTAHALAKEFARRAKKVSGRPNAN